MFFDMPKTTMPSPDRALPGRDSMAVRWPSPSAGAQVLDRRGRGLHGGGLRRGFHAESDLPRGCSETGHNPLIYDPTKVSPAQAHNPTQGMRQGNDVGTQYRSGIYVSDASQLEAVRQSKAAFQERLMAGPITTEIAGPFFYAEEYHQQYLAKNPNGYCGLGGTVEGSGLHGGGLRRA